MFNFLKNLVRKEHRENKRKKAEYFVACKPLDISASNTKNIICSDEIITKTDIVSKNGLSLHWPDNYKCHLCKHKIDNSKGMDCELEDCKFDFSCFSIGSDMNITLQVKDKIFENLKAKIVWHKKAANKEFFGKMGISFYEPIDFEF
jgi:hypothetical protein